MATDKQNINPTAEAVLAMNLWSERYAAQRGGSMDFWEKLSPYEKRRCIELADWIRRADKAHGITHPNPRGLSRKAGE